MKLWILWAIFINPTTGEEIGREPVPAHYDKKDHMSCLSAALDQPVQVATKDSVRYFVCISEQII